MSVVPVIVIRLLSVKKLCKVSAMPKPIAGNSSAMPPYTSSECIAFPKKEDYADPEVGAAAVPLC